MAFCLGYRDGFETIVGTNHFGTFTLTCLLLPLVVAAKGRIVTVSSSLHKRAQFSLDDLMGEKTRFGIGRNQYAPSSSSQAEINQHAEITSPYRYAVSKLLNLYMAYELHYKYSNRGITSVALHPGFVSTNLSRGASSFARKGDVIASFIFGKTVFQGAQTILYACLSDDVKSGGYYGDCKEEKSNPTSYNIEMASSVWEMSVIEITKRLPGFHRPV
jgi:NAD(P)-dependent dehydrogenase (short-subunit alcohol dehydrogenase family)